MVLQNCLEARAVSLVANAVPRSGRSPGGGHSNPFQYSCLENPQGQRSLVGCSPWGHRESDTAEVTEHTGIRPGSQASSFGWFFQSQAIPTTDPSNVIGFAGSYGPNGKAPCSASWTHCKSYSKLKVFWVT